MTRLAQPTPEETFVHWLGELPDRESKISFLLTLGINAKWLAINTATQALNKMGRDFCPITNKEYWPNEGTDCPWCESQ
jgi:hypothetical protein